MSGAGLALSAALQAIALFLFAAGAASLAALVKGCLVLRRMARRPAWYDSVVLLKSPLVPDVSILAVAREPSPEGCDLVRRLLALHYAGREVVLVLDGPSEAALAAWTCEFRLCASSRSLPEAAGLPAAAGIRGIYESLDPVRLLVIDKERGGEADALNAGARAASSSLLALVDPASEFDPTLLLRLIVPMLEAPETLAACAAAPPPPSGGMAGRFGALESSRLWLARVGAFSGWDRLAPVPGSAWLVRRDAVIQAGGFTAGALEMVLTLSGRARQEGKPCAIAFVPDPVSHSRPPRSFADLRGQARRDQGEIARAVAHRKLIAGGMGALGWGLPALVAARFVRPLLETAAYPLTAAGLLAGWIDPALAGVVLLATVGTGIVVSMAAVVLRDFAEPGGPGRAGLAGLFLAAIPENLGYRQLRNLWLVAGFSARGAAAQKESRGPTAKDRQPAASGAET